MYIAMNRFQVKTGQEDAFEAVWRNRKSRLNDMPGFVSFDLLRGGEDAKKSYTLFASHTVWETREDFTAWTKSQNFRDAHKHAGSNDGLYLGHPQFEGFETVEGV